MEVDGEGAITTVYGGNLSQVMDYRFKIDPPESYNTIEWYRFVLWVRKGNGRKGNQDKHFFFPSKVFFILETCNESKCPLGIYIHSQARQTYFKKLKNPKKKGFQSHSRKRQSCILFLCLWTTRNNHITLYRLVYVHMSPISANQYNANQAWWKLWNICLISSWCVYWLNIKIRIE